MVTGSLFTITAYPNRCNASQPRLAPQDRSDDECIDCGACEPVCPVEAIYYEDDLPPHLEPYREDNARFFDQPLPGRDAPLGTPGGAAKVGPLGVDTELVASHPAADTAEWG